MRELHDNVSNVYSGKLLRSMSSPPDGWSIPEVIGQAPPPCYLFTLTTVEGKRAAMFGGITPSSLWSDDLYIVDLERHSVVSV